MSQAVEGGAIRVHSHRARALTANGIEVETLVIDHADMIAGTEIATEIETTVDAKTAEIVEEVIAGTGTAIETVIETGKQVEAEVAAAAAALEGKGAHVAQVVTGRRTSGGIGAEAAITIGREAGVGEGTKSYKHLFGTERGKVSASPRKVFVTSQYIIILHLPYPFYSTLSRSLA